jgi:hypothetical protein
MAVLRDFFNQARGCVRGRTEIVGTSRNFKQWSVAAFAGAFLFAVSALPASADIYDPAGGAGPQGDLIVNNGVITISTSGAPTLNDGVTTFNGDVEAGEGNGVAVYRFNNIEVTGTTTVTVSGNRPAALVSGNDIIWSAASSIDASDGVLGGGAGGASAAGGAAGGAGGVGGSAAGGGGAAGDGGLGGLGVNNGLAGTSGGAGSAGEAGAAGSDGEAGVAGSAGALGSGTAGSNALNAAGTAGTGGDAGVAGSAVNNGGAAGSTLGTPGNLGVANQSADGGNGGDASGTAEAGAAGDLGANGGNGTNGGDAGDAAFDVAANTLDFVAGAGGGSGGGGGQGAGGQGGGQGGGGTGGAGGGGGGGMDAVNNCPMPVAQPPVPGTPVAGRGEDGRSGGAGAPGAAGGAGGTAGAAGSGGAGGNGGGAVLLAAQGLLNFAGAVDVSAGASAAGGAGAAVVAGAVGGVGAAGGAAGGAVGNATTGSWFEKDGGNYCIVEINNSGGAGGNAIAGGDGGDGGAGGSSGTSGDGGAGGEGTPGMVKLHGSVILASSASVAANSASSETGVVTLISNSSAVSAAGTAAAAAPSVGTARLGRTTNVAQLNAPTTWYPAGTNPKIGELDGGAATEGTLDNGTSWNAAQVAAEATAADPRVEVTLLESGTNGGVYDGFAQLFIVNNAGKPLRNVTIDVGNGPVLIPGSDLGIGKSFTTTVANLDLPPVVDFTRLGSLLRPVDFTFNTAIDGLKTSTSGTNVTYNGTAVIMVADEVEGLAPYVYTWLRGGSTFSQLGQTAGEVQFLTSLASSGLYKCRITDATPDPAADSLEISLTVVNGLSNPTTAPNPGATVNRGSVHNITVTANNGVAPLNYEWQLEQDTNPGSWITLDSSLLTGPHQYIVFGTENTATLSITTTDIAELEGNYRCIVSDSAPIQTAGFSFKTSTVSSLEIVNVLNSNGTVADVKAYTGEPISLEAEFLGGTPPYTVNWFKNGGVTPVFTQAGVAELTPSVLNLGTADAGDIGTYQARATDAASATVNSTVGSVDVRALPTVSTPADFTGYNGSTANFSVTASGGYPPLSYDWRQDTVSLGAPDDDALSIVVGTSDNGTDIDVVVSDAGGDSGVKTATSGAASITTADAAALSITSSGFSRYVDDPIPTVELSVTGGFSPQTFAWFLDGDNVTTLGGTVDGPSGDLTLPASALSGTLTATVTDIGGTTPSSNSIEITVAERLGNLSVPNTEARDGQPFSTPVEFDGGIAPFDYEWTRDDGSKAFQPLTPPQLTDTFSLNPATFADAGLYQIEVTDAGSDLSPGSTQSLAWVLTVVEGLPVGGGIGLGVLALVSAVGGALALRRRK